MPSACSVRFSTIEAVRMVGVEAGGDGIRNGEHAARFQGGKLGVLQGTKTFLLADDDGQIQLTHSVSAGLDYAAIGPEHAYLRDQGRIEYDFATDDEALAAFQTLADIEGIIPALETAHAIAHVIKIAPTDAATTKSSSSISPAAATRMSPAWPSISKSNANR